MERKVKYNYEFKRRCVKEVLNHHQTVKSVSELNGRHHTSLHHWVCSYEAFGKKGITSQNQEIQFRI